MLYLIVLVIGVVLGWFIRKVAEVGEPREAPAKEIQGSLNVRCPKCRATFRFGTHLWCSVREFKDDSKPPVEAKPVEPKPNAAKPNST